MRHPAPFLASILILTATPTLAQEVPPGHPPTDVPEGHPPTGEMPPGHPPTGQMPPGHPPTEEMPAGHPVVGEVPPGHPPSGEVPPGHPIVEDLPPGHPPADAPATPEAGGSPHGEGPHGGGPMDPTLERAFREPRVASADPSPAVPAGHIRVRVVDERGAPVPDQAVLLGVMRQGGDRERTPGQTDASGVYTYTELPTGSGQAYRVNVPRDGAMYSSTPFQLPTGIGYDVRVEVRPTVRSDRSLLLVMGQTMVELRDERLHIIQQVRLSNLAAATYVFPEGGTRIELPEGYTAFQTQAVMTDQRVVELAGEGLKIEGSLPTGQVTLAWAFDLPVTGSEMDIELPNPFRTFQYRVISTAPRGLSMDVEEMPTPVRFDDQGQPLLGTEIQRSPDQPALSSIRIQLRGIPGPGPQRWIAVGIASLLVALGVLLAARRGRTDGGAAHRARRREQLVAEAAQLETDFAAGEVGPEHRQSRRAAIVRELAVLLYQDERAGTGSSGEAPSPTKKKKKDGPRRDVAEKKAEPPRNDATEPPKEQAGEGKSG